MNRKCLRGRDYSDRVRDAIRRRHYTDRTEETYIHWIKRFIYFSGKRHPAELGADEVTAFLNHLAREREVAAATQNQALAALLFLYKEALGTPLPWLDDLERAKRPEHVPTVLAREEVATLLAAMDGPKWLMASLLYGGGLRLRECLKLRVKEVDFSYRQILVRDGKKVTATSSCRTRSRASIRARSTSGDGSSCFRRTSAPPIRRPA